MAIGQRIKERRIELKMSQRELADKMGYSNHSTITRIEAGKVDIPQSKIIKFAEVLQTTPSALMGWEKIEKNNDIIADIVVRMRTDSEFFSVVETLNGLDDEKLASVKQMLAAFLK